MTPTALDPLRFPLEGSRLIEASAGTGKTFTIAALYLRLVLGHGDDGAAFSRPLTPPEILVVTFTDAATKELRDRIRGKDSLRFYLLLTGPKPLRTPEDLTRHTLLHDTSRRDWKAWFRQLDIDAPNVNQGPIFSHSTMVIQAAIHGQGARSYHSRRMSMATSAPWRPR